MQRQELPEGIKVTLLPKKSRGEEVRLALTLRYGNEENLKGLETAAGFPVRAHAPRHEEAFATSNCATNWTASAPRSARVRRRSTAAVAGGAAVEGAAGSAR